MKKQNNKRIKEFYIAIVSYAFAISDVLVNTYIAQKWFGGVPQIRPSFLVGMWVVNPISVAIMLFVGTVFILLGLVRKKGEPRE